jgi:hypothetical protein
VNYFASPLRRPSEELTCSPKTNRNLIPFSRLAPEKFRFFYTFSHKFLEIPRPATCTRKISFLEIPRPATCTPKISCFQLLTCFSHKFLGIPRPAACTQKIFVFSIAHLFLSQISRNSSASHVVGTPPWEIGIWCNLIPFSAIPSNIPLSRSVNSGP